jgi:hypothetical protein
MPPPAPGTMSDDATACAALEAGGWPTVRGVHGFDFGDLNVREVHHRGPDGLTLSVIEQQKPRLTLPATGLTAAFNATILVRDFDTARRFLVETLFWQPWMEVDWDGDNPGLALLAEPAAFEGVRRVRTVIVHPTGENPGSVELIAFEGAQAGRDFADRARPPNLGALALRFAVPDLDALVARLAGHGVHPARRPVTLDLPPWGRVRLAPPYSHPTGPGWTFSRPPADRRACHGTQPRAGARLPGADPRRHHRRRREHAPRLRRPAAGAQQRREQR